MRARVAYTVYSHYWARIPAINSRLRSCCYWNVLL